MDKNVNKRNLISRGDEIQKTIKIKVNLQLISKRRKYLEHLQKTFRGI